MALINRLQILMAEKGNREKRRVTIEELSRETGVNRQTLTDWRKNDVSRWDSITVERLCRYFECDINDLLIFDPPIKKRSEAEPA